jgi:hypothetical protein
MHFRIRGRGRYRIKIPGIPLACAHDVRICHITTGSDRSER